LAFLSGLARNRVLKGSVSFQTLVWERGGDQLIGYRDGGMVVAPYNMSANKKMHFGRIERGPQLWALLLVLWVWAIWSCAEYWRGNPNYSYGWIVPVLSFIYAARRLVITEIENASRPVIALSIWLSLFFGLVAGALIFGLEFAREQVWHPIIVIWTIALIPIALTLAVSWFAAGTKLLVAELFPILFFLTAVPWPPRFEQPITAGLMQLVAAATTG
jgi:hypothetical protein